MVITGYGGHYEGMGGLLDWVGFRPAEVDLIPQITQKIVSDIKTMENYKVPAAISAIPGNTAKLTSIANDLAAAKANFQRIMQPYLPPTSTWARFWEVVSGAALSKAVSSHWEAPAILLQMKAVEAQLLDIATRYRAICPANICGGVAIKKAVLPSTTSLIDIVVYGALILGGSYVAGQLVMSWSKGKR